jgi:hypothetical protein
VVTPNGLRGEKKCNIKRTLKILSKSVSLFEREKRMECLLFIHYTKPHYNSTRQKHSNISGKLNSAKTTSIYASKLIFNS